MKACCYRFGSCTTCPECGGPIRPARPTRPAYSEQFVAELDKALRRRPDGPPSTPEDDYYDGRDL